MDNNVGERLRRLRGDRTLKEVAEAVGITPSALGMYEQNRRNPRDGIKRALAAYYGRSVAFIFYAFDTHEV